MNVSVSTCMRGYVKNEHRNKDTGEHFSKSGHKLSESINFEQNFHHRQKRKIIEFY